MHREVTKENTERKPGMKSMLGNWITLRKFMNAQGGNQCKHKEENKDEIHTRKLEYPEEMHMEDATVQEETRTRRKPEY